MQETYIIKEIVFMRPSCQKIDDIVKSSKEILKKYESAIQECRNRRTVYNALYIAEFERELNQNLYMLATLGNTDEKKYAVYVGLMCEQHIHPIVAGRLCIIAKQLKIPYVDMGKFDYFISDGWHRKELDNNVYKSCRMDSDMSLVLSGIDILAPVAFYNDITKADFLRALTQVYNTFDKVRERASSPMSLIIIEAHKIDAYLFEKIRRDTVDENIYNIDEAVDHMNEIWKQEAMAYANNEAFAY